MTARVVAFALVAGLVVGAGVWLVFTGTLAGSTGQVEIGPHKLVSHRSDRVVEAEENTQDVVVQPGEAFLVEYAFGNGQQGFDILRIDSDGSGEYRYWDQADEETRQKKLTFEVSAEDLEEICRQLNQSGFMGLAGEYHGVEPNGTQIAITVVAGEVEKEVYCDNHFPVAVVAVADYLEKEVIQPRRKRS